MATLPPVKLGAVLLGAFGAALSLRSPLERRLVLGAAEEVQPRRQFMLEAGLFVAAGALAAAFNYYYWAFPLVSAVSLAVGCLATGFFVGLDMALARERRIIARAAARNRTAPPPRRLFSMTRRFSLVAVSTALFVAAVVVMVLMRDIVWLAGIGDDAGRLTEAQVSVSLEIGFIMAVLLAHVVNLILSYARNLKMLFDNETGVLERVSQGDLSRMVPVATRDEFGLIAGHTNQMIEALRHRLQLLGALKLAEEVQRNLLPSAAPQVPGLEVAGTSIYCYETGGDYFDFLMLPNGRLGVVVADAADHGVGAALHMATARAFLLYAANNFHSPALLMEDVNRYLVRDSRPTSRFMSMFFLEIEPHGRGLRWVRAGHEPAMLYDPQNGGFSALSGDGMVLGVEEGYSFKEYTAGRLQPGSLVVIGTDGIHEAHNATGEMFGTERFREVVRRHAAAGAQAVVDAVIAEVAAFRGDAPQEDDITLAVIRVTD